MKDYYRVEIDKLISIIEILNQELTATKFAVTMTLDLLPTVEGKDLHSELVKALQNHIQNHKDNLQYTNALNRISGLLIQKSGSTLHSVPGAIE